MSSSATQVGHNESSKGQIPLRYPASEPAREPLVRELVCDLLAS